MSVSPLVNNMARLPTIDINNVNLGGIADSAYLGSKNSVDDMIGFDIHSEPGVMKVNQALTKESGTTVDDEISTMIKCTDNSTYMFALNNGKIWKRTSLGVYSLVATNTMADTSICGAEEYKGYIYYFGSISIGRWQVGTAWSTRNDTWGSSSLTSYQRPTLILNDVLYFGNSNQLGQIDGTTLSTNALDLDTQYGITALGQIGTDILMGTTKSLSNSCQIFRWNTWSVSFTNSDPIPETYINSFLPMDNFVLVSAGFDGNIYMYNGTQLELYKKVRLSASASSYQKSVNYNAVVNFRGNALFGFSAVHSLARSNRNYPYVLNKEVGISSGNYITAKIGSMVAPSSDYYLVSWTDGTTFGVDKLDSTAKFAGAYIISRLMFADRYSLTTFGEMMVAWRTKPASTGFTFSTKKNNGTMTALTPSTDQVSDTDRNIDYTIADIGEANTLQAKVAVTVSGNTAPEIEGIQLAIK